VIFFSTDIIVYSKPTYLSFRFAQTKKNPMQYPMHTEHRCRCSRSDCPCKNSTHSICSWWYSSNYCMLKMLPVLIFHFSIRRSQITSCSNYYQSHLFVKKAVLFKFIHAQTPTTYIWSGL